jgi:hypothetical protein
LQQQHREQKAAAAPQQVKSCSSSTESKKQQQHQHTASQQSSSSTANRATAAAASAAADPVCSIACLLLAVCPPLPFAPPALNCRHFVTLPTNGKTTQNFSRAYVVVQTPHIGELTQVNKFYVPVLLMFRSADF